MAREAFDEANLEIYKKINEYVYNGKVEPYDEALLKFLSAHMDYEYYLHCLHYDTVITFLDGLNSTNSIGKCYRYTRYLALGMQEPFKLYEGKLERLYRGEFTHCWIETVDSVYDVSFAGKWPKKIYYSLFNPKIERNIDLENDKKLKEYRKNLIEFDVNRKAPILKRINWYEYMSEYMHESNVFPGFYLFPCDKLSDNSKEKRYDFERLEMRLWYRDGISQIHPFPKELFSEELEAYINKNIHFTDKYTVLKDLFMFIRKHKDLYFQYRDIPYDNTLWSTAINEKPGEYSNSFYSLISGIPHVMNSIRENDTLEDEKRLYENGKHVK